jgi:hypothetical protein
VDTNLDWIEQYVEVVTAEEYYQDEPEDTVVPRDTAWEASLPDRPRKKTVDDWGCASASGRAGLLGLLLGLLGLAARRRG